MDVAVSSIILFCLWQADRCLSKSGDGISGREMYKRDGDLIVGALLAIRDYDHRSRACRSIPDYGSVRRAESIRYAVDRVNRNHSILPNVTLGYEIYDTCYDRSLALEQSLKFTEKFRNRDDVVGVVGASLSSSSELATTYLSIFEITMISHFATSDELSDSVRYPYFMRTIAPDSFQVMAVIDILGHFEWEYVAFIYSETLYGRRAFHLFRKAITNSSVCISYTGNLDVEAGEDVYRQTIEDLQELRNTSLFSVVILFAELENIHGLMKMASRKNVIGQFVWLGSDSFGIPCLHSVTGAEEVAVGAITIIPKAEESLEFNDHFRRELEQNSSMNPWIEEYKQQLLDIKEGDCPSFETLVADAVDVLSLGLDRLCGSSCSTQSLTQDRRLFHRYLTQVDFQSSSNGRIFFPSNGDPPGRYDIRQFYKDSDRAYKFRTIGEWTATHGLQMDPKLDWYLEDTPGQYSDNGIPKSRCTDPCPSYQRRVLSEDQPCCWQCEDCDDDMLVIDWTCQKSCINRTAGVYQWPSPDRKSCVDLEELKTSRMAVSVAVICLAFLGMISTVTVSWFYIQKREEKLIKASSRELSYIILIGVLLTYLSAAVYSMNANIVICTLKRVVPHLATSLIYVSIATITLRLYRIFKAGRQSMKRPKFISPTSQVAITLFLTLVPFLWAIICLIFAPPAVEVLDPSTDMQYIVKVCSLSKSHRIVQLFWDIIVVTVCCYFAFCSRNLPANYNQSRFIAFSVFSTLVVYIAFTPALFTSTRLLELYSAIGALIQATVVLLLVFIVRLYAVYYVDMPDTTDNSGHGHSQMKVTSCNVSGSRDMWST